MSLTVPQARRRSRKSRILFEALEVRRLLSFGVTTTAGSYTVDTGAQLVFSISRSNADMTSMKYNGTELEASYSIANRYSHYESGLSSSTIVTESADPAGNWIMITADDTAGVGVIQYYIARKGFNNIYMATYAASLPSPGEMRFITYTNHSVLTNAPNPSDISGNIGAVEGSDVFYDADGTTHSKFYGAGSIITDTNHGLTGTNVGLYMDMGNRETSSGGPFMKDIDYQTTSSSVTELYNYMYSGHTQTDAYRPGLQGPYALEFTTGGLPTTPDYSFIDALNLTGSIPASGRGTLTGIASGVPAPLAATVGLSNATAEYWATPDPITGAYTITGIKPGTYTETIYQGELEAGTRSVTIMADQSTAANIVDTLYIPPAIWRIGTWDGTPNGFLNSDLIANMHPSDVRMNSWTAPSALTYTVGTSTDSQFPLAQFKTGVNGDIQIVFNLTAAQAATPMTFRIGITLAFAGGRPIISVNGGKFSSAPAASTQPDSRGITRGTFRGNNWLYTYAISTSSVHSGTNTIDINVASGSSGTTYLSPNYVFDALDLVATSSLTNAPHVASITVSTATASLNAYAAQAFAAVAKDQFGNVTPANFVWTATRGLVDGAGNYTAPRSAGGDTVTATSGSIHGTASVTVLTTAPNQAPTVSIPASPAQSQLTGALSTTLSVLGADDDGEANLTYAWSTTGTPPAAAAFSANHTNAAKNTTVTFTAFGTYNFQVTITDAFGLSATSTTSVKVQADPIARYKMDVSSGAVLPDSSGDNYTASLSGAYTFTAGLSGNALHLAGGTGGGYATLPAGILAGITDFTIATWVRLDSHSTWSRIFDFGNGTSTYMFLTMDASTGLPRFGISIGGTGTEQHLDSTVAITAGVWTHVAVTLAGSTSTLYINGVAVGTNTAATLSPASLGNTLNNYLGKSQFGDPLLAGSIEDFVIFGHALSAAQVLALAAPSVVNPAAASVNPVVATTAAVSALGSDFTAGEAGLAYTWAAINAAPAAVAFSNNGTHLASSSVATFSLAGSYTLQVTITNPAGLSITSSIAVSVNQTFSSILLNPLGVTISSGATEQFTATAKDQFNQALAVQPSFIWSLTAGAGQISSTGNYTAPYAAGTAGVKAAAGGASAGTVLTIVNAAPLILISPFAAASPVSTTSTLLSALGADTDGGGEPNLIYTWATTGSVPATVVFGANGTNAAQSSVATFTKAGTYNFQLTITDLGNKSATASLQLVVAQTPTALALSGGAPALSNSQSATFAAAVTDQFSAAIASPALTWSLDLGSVGTLNAGLYTAPVAGPGTAVIRATSGSATASASLNVILSNIAGSSGADVIRLRRDANSGKLDVFINSASATYSADLSSMTDLTIAPQAGSNTIQLDFTDGDPLPAGMLTLDAAGGGFNALQILGSPAAFPLTLTHGSLGVASALSLTALSITGNSTLTLAPAATHTLSVTSLTLAAGCALDMNDNDLIVLTTDPTATLAALQPLVAVGRAGGAWNGTDIFSTAANAQYLAHGDTEFTALALAANDQLPQPYVGTFSGIPVAMSSVLIKYTYAGDATLDGLLNIDDFLAADAGVLFNRSGYANGDFDYSGSVNAADLQILTANIARQNGPQSTPDLSPVPAAPDVAPTPAAPIPTPAVPQTITLTPAPVLVTAPAPLIAAIIAPPVLIPVPTLLQTPASRPISVLAPSPMQTSPSSAAPIVPPRADALAIRAFPHPLVFTAALWPVAPDQTPVTTPIPRHGIILTPGFLAAREATHSVRRGLLT